MLQLSKRFVQQLLSKISIDNAPLIVILTAGGSRQRRYDVQHNEGECEMTWQRALFTGFMSFFAGSLLGLYSILNSPIRFVLSLGALGIGFFFFQKCKTKGIRITFVVLSFVYAILFIFMFTAVMFNNGVIPTS